MYLKWRITDDISSLTVKEFNEERNGIYGFIKLNIDKDEVGYIPPLNCELEGNDDISFWVQNSIECGIALLKNEKFECELLSLNLLKIYVVPEENVEIMLKHEDRYIKWEHTIPYDLVYKEIFEIFEKFEKEIIQINKSLLETNIIKRIITLFNEYEKMYLEYKN